MSSDTQIIKTRSQLDLILKEHKALLIFLSSPDCNICKELKPRVKRLLEDEFPKIQMFIIDAELNPELSGQLKVFSFPTILLFFEGKEYVRLGRYFGMNNFRDDLQRLYSLFFNP